MIIGITGTNGAGKGAVVDYLTQKGFAHYSARDFISAEIKKRGLALDRDSLRAVANDLRLTHSPAYVIESLFTEAKAAGGDAVIESVRAIGEANFLQKNGGVLVAVDADRALRYDRIVRRGSATDKVDFATWVAQEEREWANADAWDMDIPGVMRLAEFTIQNDGTLEELHAQVDKILKQIKK